MVSIEVCDNHKEREYDPGDRLDWDEIKRTGS